VDIEELGVMALCDDGEAADFGERVARDLANGSGHRPGEAIAITRRARPVRSIPIE
jgi:hypothetical protein